MGGFTLAAAQGRYGAKAKSSDRELGKEPTVFRRIARPLLAAASVVDGVGTLVNPKPRIEAATPLLAKGQGMMPTKQPIDPALLVQASAAVKVAAGLMMAFGWAPRIAATVLAVEVIPSTVTQHPFWAGGYPDDRKAHLQHFVKNAGLLGGLLLAITAGKPAAVKRAKKGAKKLSRKAVAKAAAKAARAKAR
jgi:uncharacterized membrane protein YphA (DoxX/SURF4 family)